MPLIDFEADHAFFDELERRRFQMQFPEETLPPRATARDIFWKQQALAKETPQERLARLELESTLWKVR